MNTKFALAIGALTLSSGLLQAAPWDYLPCPPPLPRVVFEHRVEYRENRGYRDDDDDYCPPPPPRPHCTPFWERTEVRAQVRLQKLGYYCGSIDGCFGYGSQRALMRFQVDRDLPVSGRLDRCTLRELRIY